MGESKKKKKYDSTGLSSDKVKGIFWRTQYSSKPSPVQDLGTSWIPVLVEVIQNVCWAFSKVLPRRCISGEHWDLPHWQQTLCLFTSHVAKECHHFKISKLQTSKIENELLRVKGTLLKKIAFKNDCLQKKHTFSHILNGIFL